MKSIRTEETIKLLDNIDKNLELFETNGEEVYSQSEFDKISSKLQIRRREFDAQLFFVAIMGPLKSGKSTLSNCLSRTYVSPTGFGIETTLRPSIIIKGEKESIIEYFKKNDDDNDAEVFHKVIDYLRGTSNANELKKVATISQTNLSNYTTEEKRETIKTKITGFLPKNPLITVLTVEGGDLINGEIAIIDMPGLDGQKCNYIDHPVYNMIIERSDFYLFVLSSMAAINNDTSEFFKKIIINENNRPPLWFIQNIIEAKSWREDSHSSEINEQTRHINMQISSLFQIDKYDKEILNLGKAEDGIFQDNTTLLSSSKFNDFEAKIKEILDIKRKRVYEKQCIDIAYDYYIEAEKSLSNLCNTCNAELEFMETRLIEIKEISQLCKSIFEKYNDNLNIKKQFNKDIEEEYINYKDFINEQFNNEFNSNERLRTPEIKEKFKILEQKVLEQHGFQYFDRTNQFSNKVILSIDDYVNSLEKETLSQINNLLLRFELKELPRLDSKIELKEIGSIDITPIKVKFIGNPRGRQPSKYRPITKSYQTKIEQEIDMKVKQYTKDVETKTFDILGERVKTYNKHIESEAKKFEHNSKGKVNSIRNALNLIENLKNNETFGIGELINNYIPKAQDSLQLEKQLIE